MFINSLRAARWQWRRFNADARGAVVILFAGVAMMLMLVVAGALEIHRRNQAMADLQNAADAAALAGKGRQVTMLTKVSDSAAKTEGTKAAEATFKAAISKSKYFAGTTPPVATVTWSTEGAISVTAGPKYTMIFGAILPEAFQNVTVNSAVDFARGVPTEVALVLDNTASMFNRDGRTSTRFTMMRDAAKKFTHQLFNAAKSTGDQDLVRVSVIPWATTVNVLGEAPATANYGTDAPVTSIKDKGSEKTVANPIRRQGPDVLVNPSLFKPVEWRGCIKGDDETTSYDDAKPKFKWRALNVPEVIIGFQDVAYGPLKSTTTQSCSCAAYGDDGNRNCGNSGGSGQQGFNELIERAIPQISNASLLFNRDLKDAGKPNVNKACQVCVSQTCTNVTTTSPDCTGQPSRRYQLCYASHGNGRWNAYTSQDRNNCKISWQSCWEVGQQFGTLNAPACVADPNEPSWISGRTPWCANFDEAPSKSWDQRHWDTSFVYYPIAGPNLNCPAPMLGLSGNRAQVIEYLDRMFPVPGGTHADVGLRWGLRSLSPSNDWPSFFNLTKNPTNFGSDGKKVMILLTDGENEQAVDFPGYWGCKGMFNGPDPVQPDCTGSPDPAKLDDMMQNWCKAIRQDYGVTIYAISVNVAGNSAKDKLVRCAGEASRVYAIDASDLSNVLTVIGSQVMSMRLTK